MAGSGACFRGQVVGAGTFAGRAIEETPPAAFVAEMHRWGVRHLFVWTDASREYLARSGFFTEQWRGGLWSHFELKDSDTREVITTTGSGALARARFPRRECRARRRHSGFARDRAHQLLPGVAGVCRRT